MKKLFQKIRDYFDNFSLLNFSYNYTEKEGNIEEVFEFYIGIEAVIFILILIFLI